MHATVARIVLLVSVALALVAAGSASATPEPGACQEDTKLIGPIQVSPEVADDDVTTWWELTRDGFEAPGLNPEDALKSFFGLEFDEALEAFVAEVEPADKNGNKFVCASSLGGTRAFIGDPNFAFYTPE